MEQGVWQTRADKYTNNNIKQGGPWFRKIITLITSI